MGDDDFGSTAYWRERYRDGGTSGAGSYGRLAVYKAHIVNLVAHRHRVRTVLELGCGDGHQLALFSVREYTGTDVVPEVIERCRLAHPDDRRRRFSLLSELEPPPGGYDMTLSLDVIYHLVEDDVFEDHMRALFDLSRRLVLVYSSDHDERPPSEHVRHRNYSGWVDEHRPDWSPIEDFEQPFPRVEGSHPRHTTLATFRLYGRNEADRR